MMREYQTLSEGKYSKFWIWILDFPSLLSVRVWMSLIKNTDWDRLGDRWLLIAGRAERREWRGHCEGPWENLREPAGCTQQQAHTGSNGCIMHIMLGELPIINIFYWKLLGNKPLRTSQASQSYQTPSIPLLDKVCSLLTRGVVSKCPEKPLLLQKTKISVRSLPR